MTGPDRLRVAFQGQRGAYSEQALRQAYGEDAEPVPCASLAEAFRAGEDEADRAVVPVENATAGSINEAYDRLLETDLEIEAETVVEVRHRLLAAPGVELADLERVRSHPQALEQCRAALEELGLEPVAAADTAGSARWIAEQEASEVAAIASELAGRLYGLETLVEDLQDRAWNRTRFLCLGPDRPARDEERDHRTSLVLSTDHSPGALHRALEPFARRAINLTKLESRPTRERPWEYLFYLDVEGHVDEAPIEDAIDELGADVPFLEVLGSFPQHQR